MLVWVIFFLADTFLDRLTRSHGKQVLANGRLMENRFLANGKQVVLGLWVSSYCTLFCGGSHRTPNYFVQMLAYCTLRFPAILYFIDGAGST
jgi:hypothetical protein